MRALILGLVLFMCACTPGQKQTDAKATTDLKETLIDYNMKMRWGLWEQASQYIDPAFKQAFIGELEERGDDYKIVDIEAKNVIFDGTSADVEYEMEYHSESMVVKKEKFVDHWEQFGGVWLRQKSMTKKEWRDRKIKKEIEAKEKAMAAEAAKASTNNAATTTETSTNGEGSTNNVATDTEETL